MQNSLSSEANIAYKATWPLEINYCTLEKKDLLEMYYPHFRDHFPFFGYSVDMVQNSAIPFKLFRIIRRYQAHSLIRD